MLQTAFCTIGTSAAIRLKTAIVADGLLYQPVLCTKTKKKYRRTGFRSNDIVEFRILK
jgi:hypothetical protein